MAVAEKTPTETVPHNPQQQLAMSAVLGGLFIVVSLGIVFSGLPTLWRELQLTTRINEFLADALLLVMTVPVMVGLVFAGRKLRSDHPARGVRAGTVLAAIALFAALLLTLLVGNLLA